MSELFLTASGGSGGAGVPNWLQLFSSLSELASSDSERVIEGRKLDAFQILSSGEGTAIARVFGRMRIGGHVIFADKVREIATSEQNGGKGAGQTSVRRVTFNYSISFAVGLCQGPISQIGRIWADGKELDQSLFSFRLNTGEFDQAPDPLLQEMMGDTDVPAFRGLAYVVFLDFDLSAFGNRLPQLSFEVFGKQDDFSDILPAISIIPGATEFGYDPIPHARYIGHGRAQAENTHVSANRSDWSVSLDQLKNTCPNIKWVSLVVTWFGDDLRLGSCRVMPRVESYRRITYPTQWSVAGLERHTAYQVSQIDGRPAFGGTPSDESVIRSIRDLKARGYKIMFYPFIMMDIPKDNHLPAPSGEGFQPAYPWRGEISAVAHSGTPEEILEANKADIDSFVAGDNGSWGLTHMISHYATLCKDAGGVDAFIIGSELRGVSRTPGPDGEYPFAQHLINLASIVKGSLPNARVSYAADWSEYGRQVTADQREVFPLDAFWASHNCDFIGIDAYFPLSDWREGDVHLDAGNGASSIYDIGYLQSQIRGGEQFDYYYKSDADRDAQVRTPLRSSSDNPHLSRLKDIKAWWSQYHSIRSETGEVAHSPWVPQSKPIWFTEIGCPAVDKGSNQPNLFPDIRGGEEGLPHYSSGARDDYIQRQYLRAFIEFYREASHNPTSSIYAGSMIAADGFFAWAWDARPYPAFPYAADIWTDAPNWQTGHWLNARLSSANVDNLIHHFLGDDVRLEGLPSELAIDGYVVNRVQTRKDSLQPLLEVFGLDIVGGDNGVRVVPRSTIHHAEISKADLVTSNEGPSMQYFTDEAHRIPNILYVHYFKSHAAYELAVAVARRPEGRAPIMRFSVPMVMSDVQAVRVAERLLQELWGERSRLNLHVSRAFSWLDPCDIIRFEGVDWRITSIEFGATVRLEMVRHASWLYGINGERQPRFNSEMTQESPYTSPAVYMPFLILLDLPADWPARPRTALWPAGVPLCAATGQPFPNDILVTNSSHSWQLNGLRQSVIGETLDALTSAPSGRWVANGGLRIRLFGGIFSSLLHDHVLNGGNVLAIQTSRGWEILQFQNAELIDEDTYLLNNFLRGQAGSISMMDETLPAGAVCVLIDDRLTPLPFELSNIPPVLDYAYGPDHMDRNSYAWQRTQYTLQRIGVRPLAPVHFKATNQSDAVLLSWVRCSRLGGDDFESADIPIGETQEQYRLIIYADGQQIRVHKGSVCAWSYSAADISADRHAYPLATRWTVSISQLSSLTDTGFEKVLDITPILNLH